MIDIYTNNMISHDTYIDIFILLVIHDTQQNPPSHQRVVSEYHTLAF